MGKVRLEVMPWLGETMGMAAASEEVIPGPETGGDKSVRSLLDKLCTRYQLFDQFVFDNNTRQLTGKVVIFLNGRELELGEGLETKLADGDTLTLVPLIVGG
ncbi:MAG: MoaD/ThiS family protein [Chloroflexi bacterium]|nr:MoaD/ThiS family protein [Chloroflexota bacterium]